MRDVELTRFLQRHLEVHYVATPLQIAQQNTPGRLHDSSAVGQLRKQLGAEKDFGVANEVIIEAVVHIHDGLRNLCTVLLLLIQGHRQWARPRPASVLGVLAREGGFATLGWFARCA